MDKNAVTPGGILKVRLTWRAPDVEELAAEELPPGGVVGFVHLLNKTGSNAAAQQDKMLINLQNAAQSPLLPGQTVGQGYGLRLPNDLAPGSYSLIAGVYLAGTGQPLLRADNLPDGFLYLTNIIVRSEE